MKVYVDHDACQANGQCEAMAPNLFRLTDDDELEFAFDGQPLPAESEDDARYAVSACPVRALTIDS